MLLAKNRAKYEKTTVEIARSVLDNVLISSQWSRTGITIPEGWGNRALFLIFSIIGRRRGWGGWGGGGGGGAANDEAVRLQSCKCTFDPANRTHILGYGSAGEKSRGSLCLLPPCWSPSQERKIPSPNPACAGIFSKSSHTSDLKIGTPAATLPGAWCYRVSAGTGWPGVSIL